MNAKQLMEKASQAAASARTLLAAGDADGACNRAHYAMFDAARASLLLAGFDIGKTHRGVLSAFSEHIIKTERLPKEMGRVLKQAETRRYLADYEGDPLEIADANEMSAQADAFLAAIQTAFFPIHD